MNGIFNDWNTSVSGTVWGLPEGLDAFALKHLADHHNHGQTGGQTGAVFIAVDSTAMSRMQESLLLAGVLPQDIMLFPAWDCLPYDRVSPNGAITGARLKALAEIHDDPNRRRIILTSINAWLQRLPPPEYFDEASLFINLGANLSQKELIAFAAHNAYRRCDTVREAGEFAVRGGIVDVFPPGHDDPVRIDFFDTRIETIKRFDASTQRSHGTIQSLNLHPVHELMLNDDTIKTFRRRYLELFGAVGSTDPLYQSISEGRHHPGMEQMLPLFHHELVPLSAYTKTAPILIEPDVPAAMAERLEQIEDFYTSRLMQNEDGGSIWRPLAPSSLYLDAAAWAEQGSDTPRHQIAKFSKQEASADVGFDAGGKLAPIYHGVVTAVKTARDTPPSAAPPPPSPPSLIVAEAIATLRKTSAVVLAAYTVGAHRRMDEMIAEHLPPDIHITPVDDITNLKKGMVVSTVWPIDNGFTVPNLVVITEKDIYGNRIARPQTRRRKGADFLREVSSLAAGDLVVHVDHGIGRYEGLEKITTSSPTGGNIDHDCLLLIYAGGDKLFLPVENIDLLSRYGSEGAGDGQLDRLGGSAWQARKSGIKGRIKDIAEQLIKIAASREISKAEPIIPNPGTYAEFCQRFPYAETDDQMDTIDDVMADLCSGRVMDRLICGDVGFGKTEIALRAAFVVAMAGFQVAVVTPTTLLARQHGKSFTDRFKGFPVKIGVLSRMTGAGASARLKKDINSGECQVVIGTHALLSTSTTYSNLGLVIVDEEQNFGVSQKEKLKSLRGDIHVLTLSATPIPRTLQMALSGVREMSIITTPPVDRLAVRTSIGPWDGVVLAEAIRRERFRGGQVFCVCPRIEQLGRIHDRLQKIVPESRIITAHGQMPAAELDLAMTQFGEGEADILLSTNIIESGIDIPSANTMIINRSDMLGLSQLYQLRGRVGRGRQRAYAYLTIDENRILTPSAKRRLEVMQTLDALGAGFTLSSYDLDIRGAGNLLGDEQSGHVREVGVELYQDMLKDAVAVAKMGGDGGEATETPWSPVINMGTAVLIPDDYVKDLTVRLSLYRRVASMENPDDLDQLSVELVDRFGAMPEEVKNLLDTISIKMLCRMAHIEKVDAGPKGLSLSFRNNSFPNPARLIGHIAQQGGAMQLTSDHRLIIKQVLPISSRAKAIKDTLDALVALAI